MRIKIREKTRYNQPGHDWAVTEPGHVLVSGWTSLGEDHARSTAQRCRKKLQDDRSGKTGWGQIDLPGSSPHRFAEV